MEIIVGILLILAMVWFFRTFKFPHFGSLVMVTGGVKCGKTTFCVAEAIRTYKRNLLRWKLDKAIKKLFRKEAREMPLLYSNIPLAREYVPLTKDLIQRKVRFRYGSVIILSEASLVADSMTCKDTILNEEISLFAKLIGHELRGNGGTLFLDTQCISDVHYGFKRSLSEYYYIHHLTTWTPFFCVAHCQECRYSDDNSTIVTQPTMEDNEHGLMLVLIPKSTWKVFDSYCYSAFTDDLPVSDATTVEKDDLRVKDIVSFRIFKTLWKGKKNDG